MERVRARNGWINYLAGNDAHRGGRPQGWGEISCTGEFSCVGRKPGADLGRKIVSREGGFDPQLVQRHIARH